MPKLEIGKTCSILEVPMSALGESEQELEILLALESMAIDSNCLFGRENLHRFVLPAGWEIAKYHYKGCLRPLYQDFIRQFGSIKIVQKVC